MEDELDGYREWKEAAGGYFGGPEDSDLQTPLDILSMMADVVRRGNEGDPEIIIKREQP